MGKVIVSNIISVDGFYEGKDGSLGELFRYMHQDYRGDDKFDHYQAERLSKASTLLIGGQSFFLSNKTYWTDVLSDETATAIRKEIAMLMRDISKVVVSDQLNDHELAPWDNTRIVRRADAYKEIHALRVSVQLVGGSGAAALP